MIVGNNKNNKLIQGVPKQVALYVYRTDKNTTIEPLTNHLKGNFPEVLVEAITSKHPEIYSSFKVTILEKHDKYLVDLSTAKARFLQNAKPAFFVRFFTNY